MNYGTLLSALSNFVLIIADYLSEIWEFLIFIGRIAGVIVILVGAIMWLTQINVSKGKGMILSGIILSIVVQYFVMYPPTFIG
ncbi:MAG TPA: hypothetical protein ENG31_03110 [Candidatus Thorarchaeota archaeon]|nr:MAG: hypothetical protein DRO73_01200 [Candidatus Thorarchaeota archaeon]RLI62756.1 MAG: hypothetical protein DRO93_00165 [Candidatus Thorarchaeota archaeon]HDD67591.1 hypothetical protein [Candidatus Thorarchaeota archaeon]